MSYDLQAVFNKLTASDDPPQLGSADRTAEWWPLGSQVKGFMRLDILGRVS